MRPVNIERILYAIDFSEFSRDALDHAVALAKWHRAALTLIHVIEIPLVPIDIGPGQADSVAPFPDRDTVAGELRDFARPSIGTAELQADVLIAVGTPAVAIQMHAERMRADLVVLSPTSFRTESSPSNSRWPSSRKRARGSRRVPIRYVYRRGHRDAVVMETGPHSRD